MVLRKRESKKVPVFLYKTEWNLFLCIENKLKRELTLMPQFIQNIQIKNFKSAKNVRFEDCKRINLLIGRPNVGKSNLLEALSIFYLPFLKYLKKKDLQQFVRVENISELFCNGNVEK